MELTQRHTTLSAYVVEFCRFLRTRGFILGPREEVDALNALTLVPLHSHQHLRATLQVILAKTHYQFEQFNGLYFDFWKKYQTGVDAKTKEEEQEKPNGKRGKKQKGHSLQALKDWLYGKPAEEETSLHTYSNTKIQGNASPHFPDENLDELKKLIQRLAMKLANHHNRRSCYNTRGTRVAIRQSIRQNLKRGGEIMELHYQHQKQNQLRLMLLCDVSRSMELYTKFLLQFVFTFQNLYRKIDTFTIGTELTHISDDLKETGFEEALASIGDHVPDWSGGTRLGECFQQFLELYLHKLNHRTIIMILSDGLDTGDADLIDFTMRKMHQKVGKIIWLNPLAGNPDYRAETAAMVAAMPHVDLFLPFYEASSIRLLNLSI